MIGRCALCRELGELVPSHVLPAKFLPDLHGPRGRDPFRFASYGKPLVEAVSAVGPQLAPSVCRDCRGQVSAWEDLFARDILRWNDGGNGTRPRVRYDQWLPRLGAALGWRVLASVVREPHAFTTPALERHTLDALETWRAYAAGEQHDVGPFSLHMLPIARIAEPDDQRWYAREVVHLQPVMTRTGDAWVWMKLPGVLLLGTIHQGRASALTNSRLQPAGAAAWGDVPIDVPGIVRFLMFEELQRSLHEWRSAAEPSFSECAGL